MRSALIAVAVLFASMNIHAQNYAVAMMGEVNQDALGQIRIVEVNEAGVVAGEFTGSYGDCYHPFVWAPGWNAALDLGCGRPSDIGEVANGKVQVVGTGVGAYTHATIWEVTLATRGVTELDVHDRVPNGAGEQTSYLTSINSRGEIVGHTGSGTGFLLRAGQTSPLIALPYRPANFKLNDYGAIVGDYSTPQGNPIKKYVMEHGRFSFVEDMGEVVTINNRGQVAGRRSYAEPQWRGVVYENGETRELPLADGYTFSGISDMNDHGEIVGQMSNEWGLSDGPFYVWRGEFRTPSRLEFASGQWPNCKGCWGKILQAKMNSQGRIAGLARYLTDEENPRVIDAGFVMNPIGGPVNTQLAVTQIPTTAVIPSREKGLIVYVNRFLQQDGAPELYIMKGDGTSPVRLTTNTANEDNPAVSPDGNHIAFESDRDGSSEIYRMALDGSNVVQLTSGWRAKWPAWSPDGTKIALAMFANNNWDIWVMDAYEGASMTNLTVSSGIDEVQPSWSADGLRIAYATNASGHFEIHDRAVAGPADVREITSQAEAWNGNVWGNRFQPLFEPVGGRITWIEHWWEWSHVYSSNPASPGIGVQHWSNCYGCAYGDSPSWSSNRTKLAYTDYSSEPYGQIVVIDAADSASTVIAAGSYAPDWVPTVAGGGGTGIPTNVVAYATSTSRVVINWRGVDGATGYELHRKAPGSPYALRMTTTATSFSDTGLAANTTYLYKVRALFPAPSDFSAVDAATTVTFTDDPLVPGMVAKAVHVTQLRAAVSSMYAAADTTPPAFTDPVLSTSTTIKAAHLLDLRAALNSARSALNLSPITFSDPSTVRYAPIRAADFNQLRNGVD